MTLNNINENENTFSGGTVYLTVIIMSMLEDLSEIVRFSGGAWDGTHIDEVYSIFL
jgi:hypothetical protein